MYQAKTITLDPKTILYRIEKEDRFLSVAEVMQLWIEDRAFRSFYNQLLAEAPFPAYFWELPPMTLNTIEVPFEFVLVNSGTLAKVQANDRPFRDQFTDDQSVVVFPNLGGDATLVVPTPETAKSTYAHLAQFVRNAPREQIDLFWQKVGRAYHENLSDKKLWLSTSGLGVYWLHVRLDSRPKYYTHQAYRQ
jgi:hypothetical protein